MQIEIRSTHSFVELKVDMVEATIFHSDTQEIDETIENMKVVIEHLEEMKQEHKRKTLKDQGLL